MIFIRNISSKRWAISTDSFNGSNDIPLLIALAPKDKPDNFVYIMKDNLKNYGEGVKQTIADAVSTGIVEVQEVDSVHIGMDKTPAVELRGSLVGLQGIFDTANEFKADFNRHIVAPVHTAPGVTFIVAPDAIDVPTLIVLITNMQTQYNAHIGAGIHPTPDTSNVIFPVVAPVDAPTCLIRLKEVMGLYKQHKKFSYLPVLTPPLTPAQIITY